jgi:MFS family permease
MYYGPDILISAGLTIPGMDAEESALLLNIPLATVNAIGTLGSIFIIDRFGRRFSMLRCLPFATIGWLVTAFGMYLYNYSVYNDSGSYIAFGGIIMFLISFSLGMSSTPWTVNAEIYPLHVIGSANSLSTTTNWASNFVVATVFLIFLETPLGSVLCFIVLAGLSILAYVFIFFLLPETANRTIDEILEDILGSVNKAETDETGMTED